MKDTNWRLLIYLFFLLAICFSCNREKQVNAVEVINPELTVENSYVNYPIKDNRIIVDLDRPQKVSLFDYFSHIQLIPLETNDDILIGYCEEVLQHQNRYYIFDRKPHKIHIFDKNGKFLFQIDKRGQGPGEYTAGLASVLINPFTENIDLTDLGRIYSYDLTGKHVRTIPRPENSTNYFWNFIAINENTYVGYILSNGGLDSYKINYYDVKANKVVHKEYETDVFLNTYAHITSKSHTVFYVYNGKYFFYHLVDNTTYEVGVDSLTEAYTWDFGKYNYDAKDLKLPNDPFSIITLPYRIFLQGQNNKYLLAQIGLRNDISKSGAYLIHDKSTNECKYIEQFAEFVNFNPRKITNEYVLTWCQHGELEDYISEEMLDEENLQKFRELINAKDEQNTILIKYYFK